MEKENIIDNRKILLIIKMTFSLIASAVIMLLLFMEIGQMKCVLNVL